LSILETRNASASHIVSVIGKNRLLHFVPIRLESKNGDGKYQRNVITGSEHFAP